MPWDVFVACGVKEEDVLAERTSDGIKVALTRLADIAVGHLAKAEAAIGELPRELRAAFAHIALLKLQLKRIDFESPFQRPPDASDVRKIAALWWWQLRRG